MIANNSLTVKQEKLLKTKYRQSKNYFLVCIQGKLSIYNNSTIEPLSPSLATKRSALNLSMRRCSPNPCSLVIGLVMELPVCNTNLHLKSYSSYLGPISFF